MIRSGVVERIFAAGLVADDSEDHLWAFRALRDSATESEKYAAWGLLLSSLLLDAERSAAETGASAAWWEQFGGLPDLSRSLWDTWLRVTGQMQELAAQVAGCVGRGA